MDEAEGRTRRDQTGGPSSLDRARYGASNTARSTRPERGPSRELLLPSSSLRPPPHAASSFLSHSHSPCPTRSGLPFFLSNLPPSSSPSPSPILVPSIFPPSRLQPRECRLSLLVRLLCIPCDRFLGSSGLPAVPRLPVLCPLAGLQKRERLLRRGLSFPADGLGASCVHRLFLRPSATTPLQQCLRLWTHPVVVFSSPDRCRHIAFVPAILRRQTCPARKKKYIDSPTHDQHRHDSTTIPVSDSGTFFFLQSTLLESFFFSGIPHSSIEPARAVSDPSRSSHNSLGRYSRIAPMCE